MDGSNTFLATLAQSAAAIVAIIGGFLVSRLVALSSEREGLRRQLQSAQANLDRVRADYEVAHEYRYENSYEDFAEWAIDRILAGDYEPEVLLEEFIPRGSSKDETRPILRELEERVAAARREIERWVLPTDDWSLAISDLENRGLEVPPREEMIYTDVVKHVAESLPTRRSSMIGGIPAMPFLRDPALLASDREIEMRRLDESVQEEQRLRSERDRFEGQLRHVKAELIKLGRPIGVTSASVILALYSLLGIALPLVAMVAANGQPLEEWQQWALLVTFLVGLGCVLAYMLWYTRTLNHPLADDLPTDSGVATERPPTEASDRPAGH